MDNIRSPSKIFEDSKYSIQFQIDHSTDHANAQLVDQIYESFEKNEYTLGMFIDLCKAFHTGYQSILLRKFELYSITDKI